MSETDNYKIRTFLDSDLDMVLDLWEHHSDWGRPGREEFSKWMITPFGNCHLFVAENTEGEIVGQMYLTPTELFINGTTIKAIKSSAPIIHGEYRSTSMFSRDSVLIQLIVEGYKEVLKMGFEWMYSFPAFGWMRLMESLHHIGLNKWKVQPYNCIEIIENGLPDIDLVVKQWDQFPDTIQTLVYEFQKQQPNRCFFTRTISWLNYKWGDDLKIGIYSNLNTLIGYAVIRPSDGLLLDFILIEQENVAQALVLINNFIHHKLINIKEKRWDNIKLMEMPYFSHRLDKLNTRIVDHKFVFGLSSLTNENILDKIDFDDFYIFPMD